MGPDDVQSVRSGLSRISGRLSALSYRFGGRQVGKMASLVSRSRVDAHQKMNSLKLSGMNALKGVPRIEIDGRSMASNLFHQKNRQTATSRLTEDRREARGTGAGHDPWLDALSEMSAMRKSNAPARLSHCIDVLALNPDHFDRESQQSAWLNATPSSKPADQPYHSASRANYNSAKKSKNDGSQLRESARGRVQVISDFDSDD